MSTLIDITGERFGRWIVLRRKGTERRYGRRHLVPLWLCECNCGERRVVRGDSLRNGISQSCGCVSKEKNAERLHVQNYKGDDIGYTAAHYRIEAKHGKASEYECEHCSNQAEQWALMNHAKQVVEEFSEKFGWRKYSLNVDDYMPLCRLCHKRYD